jgi:3-oxoacyl-[acyl-carrier-protein] synthase-3
MAQMTRCANILGTGIFLPERRVTNAELEAREYASSSGERFTLPVGEIEARTGIRERYYSDLPTSELAARAGAAALADAGLTIADVDLVLVATSTPDHPSPKTAPRVAHLLGANGVAAWDAGKDCTGFLEALETAHQFVRVGARERVLVIAADRMTTLFEPTNKATALVFGDGAGAAVVGPVAEGGWLGSVGGTAGDQVDKLYVPARDAWLSMDGKAVFDFASGILPHALTRVTEAFDLPLDAIDLVVPHQANLRILEKAVATLGWPRERFVINVDRYGNTAAAAVAIALHEAHSTGRIRPGMLVAMAGYGAGIAWMASLFRA